MRLGGLDPAELRAQKSHAAKVPQSAPFLCRIMQSRALLINRACTTARGAELAYYRAFRDLNGLCTQEDLLQGFNRLSSFLWILEIRLASGQEKRRGETMEGTNPAALPPRWQTDFSWKWRPRRHVHLTATKP